MIINVDGINKIDTKLEQRKQNSFLIDVDINDYQAEILFYQLWNKYGDEGLQKWLNMENKKMIDNE